MAWYKSYPVVSLFFLSTVLMACPEAEEESPDQGQVQDLEQEPDTTTDLVEDPDAAGDLASDPDLQVEDMQQIDLVGECEPYSISCTPDGYGIRRCSYNGAWLNPSPCGTQEVCEETTTGASCVDCTPGVNCRDDEPICTPSEPFCYDYQTAAQCTAEGRAGTTVQCSGRCIGGGCNNAGSTTGSMCEANVGCQGLTCVCGTEDEDNSESALCGGDLAGGYCTTGSCHVNGCDPVNEVCVDFDMSGAFGGDQVCLLKSNCSHRLYDCAAAHRGTGHVCRELPSNNWNGTRRTWHLACWVPPPANPEAACTDANCLSPIGGACQGNEDCVGGNCMRNDSSVSYCVGSCDETHECPSYSSCVRIPELGDNYYCLANATSAECPRLGGFDIVTRTFGTIDGVTNAQVCFFRN
ncbi:MAG: hypothetical protein JW797_07035 [Bradymonadales bacterium]|nr:hypothetical protein [Bradymonadales bacterium]